MSYQNRFVRTTIISRFSVICKDLIRFSSGLHFSDSNVYFYVIPRFERLRPRASAGAVALPDTLLRSAMTARLPTCSCRLTKISPDVILIHGVGNANIYLSHFPAQPWYWEIDHSRYFTQFKSCYSLFFYFGTQLFQYRFSILNNQGLHENQQQSTVYSKKQNRSDNTFHKCMPFKIHHLKCQETSRCD